MEDAFARKKLPYNLDAEKSVIGSMLMDRDAIVEASDMLTKEDFYYGQYGILFENMVELFKEGMKLVTIDSMDTRPTTDRIKETLFNMLSNDIPGCRFLDVFSGSGAIGIEALSRGAAMAVFVENSRKAVECINKNLAFTKLADRAQV